MRPRVAAEPSDEEALVRVLRRALARFASKALLAAGAAYAIVGSAQLLSFPTAAFWVQNKDPAYTFLFLVSVPLLWTSAWRVHVLNDRVAMLRDRRDAARRALERERQLRLLENSCKPLLVLIADRTELSVVSLGAVVWRTGLDAGILTRVVDFKVHSRQHSGVAWTRGKGVIGRCWADGKVVLADLTGFRGMSRTEFDRVPSRERLALTWDELQWTRDYTAVWAMPLKDETGAIVGVISIDCDAERAADALRSVIDDKVVLGVIETIRANLLTLLVSGEVA